MTELRVAEKGPANTDFYRSNLRAISPEMLKAPAANTFLGIPASADISGEATSVERMMRHRVLRMDRLNDFQPIKTDALTVMRIVNSLNSAGTIPELLETAVDRLGQNFKALVEIEVRSDILDQARPDAPSEEHFPNLIGRNRIVMEKLCAARAPLTENGSDGETIITCPLLDGDRNFMGALRFRTWLNFAREEIDLIRQFGDMINQSLNRLAEIEKLKTKSTTDALTGLKTKEFFLDFLEAEFAYCNRYKMPMGLLFLDLDHFKKINDTYGHQAGDMVLKEVARTISNLIRKSDVAARYGGEELVVVLRDTEYNGIRTLAEKIRKAIADLELVHEGQRIPVTASIGVASYIYPIMDGPSNLPMIDTAEEMIRIADDNMYHAKANGRNMVIY